MGRPAAPRADEVLRAASALFGVSVEELRGRARWDPLTEHRHVSMAALRQLTGASFPAIGRYFDGRDHTTIMHATAAVYASEALVDRLGELVELVELGGRPRDLLGEVEALRAEVDALRAEVARLGAPDRVAVSAGQMRLVAGG